MRVLYVDDHERFRSLAARQFLAHHEVVFARTLHEARVLLASEAFEAVLLDFDLPDGKGLGLMPELQARGLAARTVAVSSFDQNNALLLAAGVGAALGKLQFARIAQVLDELAAKNT